MLLISSSVTLVLPSPYLYYILRYIDSLSLTITYNPNSRDPIGSKNQPEDKTEQNLKFQTDREIIYLTLFSFSPPIFLDENAEAAQTCRYCVLSVIQSQWRKIEGDRHRDSCRGSKYINKSWDPDVQKYGCGFKAKKHYLLSLLIPCWRHSCIQTR